MPEVPIEVHLSEKHGPSGAIPRLGCNFVSSDSPRGCSSISKEQGKRPRLIYDPCPNIDQSTNKDDMKYRVTDGSQYLYCRPAKTSALSSAVSRDRRIGR